MKRVEWLPCALAGLLAACGGTSLGPAQVDTRNDTCQNCRMPVSNARLAAQIVAPSEEPLFFDDIGCLASFLRRSPALHEGAVAYVADHRTGSWVPAAAASYTIAPGVETPMGSHIIAHLSPASRDADPALATGGARPALDVFPRGSLGSPR